MKRILLYSLSAVFIAIVAYANLRHVNPSVSLEPVDVCTLAVTNMETTEPEILRAWLRQNKNVSAVSINADASLVGITYHYNKLAETELIELASMNGALKVSKKTLPKSEKAACPIHGAMTLWERTLNFLRW
ncbi:MAG: hypothetical protein ACKVOR_00800 [Flavobacteriales bacterium]